MHDSRIISINTRDVKGFHRVIGFDYFKSKHQTDKPHYYWKSLSSKNQAQWNHIADDDNIKNLFSIVEKTLFADNDYYDTYQHAEETGTQMLVFDCRDYGYGERSYYYEKIYIEIIYVDLFHHKKHLKKTYIVANEIMNVSDYQKYANFCQCSNCLFNHKRHIIPSCLYKIWHRSSPCLMGGSYDDQLLKKTRAAYLKAHSPGEF